MICDNCGFSVDDSERGNLVITSVANGNQGESIDAKDLGKDLCKDCALTIQHDLFHRIYDL